MNRYRRLADAQWSTRAAKRRNGMYVHQLRCCDCGLAHVVQYDVTERGLRFRAWRLPKRNKKVG